MQRIFNYWKILVLITLATLLAYSPAFKNNWTKWDDTQYILENPLTEKLSADNLQQIFSTPIQGNYIPLTFLSFTIDRTLWGDRAGVFISINILFHLLNTLLVFFLIRLLIENDRAALICTLLFGLHPLHVESVAWIVQRKDVLYAFYFFLSLIIYIRYVKSKKFKWFLFSFFLMVLSVLSKNTAVILPCILLLVDYFLKRPLSKKIVLEKIPFFIISLLFIYIGTNAVKLNAGELSSYHLSFIERMATAAYAFTNYITKLFIPLNLSAYYPYPFSPNESMPSRLWMYFFFCLALFITLFLYAAKKPLLIFSMLFFIFNLLPSLQLFPVGDALFADRFIYVASVGFFLPIALLGNNLLQNRKFNTMAGALLVMICTSYFYLTYQRTRVWKDAKTLWNDVLNKNDGVSLAHTNMGTILYEESKKDSAIIHYTKAIAINPKNKIAYYNRGTVYYQERKYEAAIADFKMVVNMDNNDKDAWSSMGFSYNALKKYDSTVQCFSQYIKMDSSSAEVYAGRGLAKHLLKNHQGAMNDYSKAIELFPSYADVYGKRGVLKIEMGDTSGACTDWIKANQLGLMDTSPFISEYCK